jgi:hypothetical protein
MKLEFSEQIPKILHIRFHENPSNWSRQTNRQADMTELIVAF